MKILSQLLKDSDFDDILLFIDKEYIEFQTGFVFKTINNAKKYFLSTGWKEGIDPCALFSVEYYNKNNPDTEALLTNPLIHYLKFGYKKGLSPHFLIDAGYYLHKSGLDRSCNVLKHYITSEIKPSPSPYFNERYYKRVNGLSDKDVGLEHFIKNGVEASTHPLIKILEIKKSEITLGYIPYNFFKYSGGLFFDPKFYGEKYPDVINHGFLNHFIVCGKNEQRMTNQNVYGSLSERCIKYDLLNYDSALEYLMDSLLLKQNAVAKFAVIESSVAKEVDMSVVIVNFNKSLMTVQCVAHLLLVSQLNLQIIIVDNGSQTDDIKYLDCLKNLTEVNVVELDVNRFFGEANNIGVEEASAEIICFLNNDAFVTPQWDTQLVSALNRNGYAATPKFLYPSGLLQEAGGQINSCGQNVQFGKGLSQKEPQFNFPMNVNHASAACLLMKKSIFNRLAGFDLRYEPAYFEDADLSAKLMTIGGSIRYCPTSVIYHVENVTSKDPRIGFDFGNLIAINRLKFVDRWGEFLRGNKPVEITDNSKIIEGRLFFSTPKISDKIALVYSPYNLVPGGGERYILSVAAALSGQYTTYFCTPSRYSYYRLASIGSSLGVDVSSIRLIDKSRLNDLDHIDVHIVMGNELLPEIQPMGVKANVYHCQFPFPMEEDYVTRNLGNAEAYDCVVVNSEFTKKNYEKQANFFAIEDNPIHVINPPVNTQSSCSGKNYDTGQINILNVGRFIAGGHCKKQKEILSAFIALCHSSSEDGNLYKLTFIGSLSSSPADIQYFNELKILAEDYNVIFIVNACLDELCTFYETAHFYWHGTGINESFEDNPEVFEHFGITPVEAMSRGAIPIVWYQGGPSEVCSNFKNLHAHNIEAYGRITLEILASHPRMLSDALKLESNKYSEKRFSTEVQSLVKSLLNLVTKDELIQHI
jgi:GT2 family glycosyltransferase